MAKERQRDQHLAFLKGIRHSKFGSQLQVRREDGTMALVQQIYNPNIEVNNY